MPDALSPTLRKKIDEILERKGFRDLGPRQESYSDDNISYSCIDGHRLTKREDTAYCTKCMNSVRHGTFYVL